MRDLLSALQVDDRVGGHPEQRFVSELRHLVQGHAPSVDPGRFAAAPEASLLGREEQTPAPDYRTVTRAWGEDVGDSLQA